MAESSRPRQKAVDVTQLSVLDVLSMCERDFAFIGGCTMTDRPDLPLSSETSWKMDSSQVLAAIAVAKEKLNVSADSPEERERHSACLFSGREDPFAPISLLNSEGRCTQCISTIDGKALCR